MREAMEKAKELEKKPVPTTEEIVGIYKEGLQEAEKLRKLLSPEWFVKDVHEKPKKAKTKKTKKKTTKPKKKSKTKSTAKTKRKPKRTRKKSSSTRKKKSL